MNDKTMTFSLGTEHEREIHEIMFQVYNALKEKGYNYTMMRLPFMDISSTKVRENVYNSIPIKKLVPHEVEKYIDRYGLYKY